MGHRFDPTILREYDIRGIVGKTLSSADAQAIGRAYALTLVAAGSLRIAVGYDGRLTSPELEAALVDGLVTEGADVVRIGTLGDEAVVQCRFELWRGQPPVLADRDAE